MDSLLFLIPIGLLILVASFWVFFWTIRNKQYEDLDGAAQRILLDNEKDNSE